MKFKQTLNELQAEITGGGKIPLRKIYINGNIPQNIPPKWKSVLESIIRKLRKLNLIDKFSTDREPVDIEGIQPRGNITLKADDGSLYIYNSDTDTLYDSNKKKLG
jgi:hypothetical protein